MADSGDFKKTIQVKIFFNISRKPACAKASAGRDAKSNLISDTCVVYTERRRLLHSLSNKITNFCG